MPRVQADQGSAVRKILKRRHAVRACTPLLPAAPNLLLIAFDYDLPSIPPDFCTISLRHRPID